jgi:hypothetical protein
MIMKSLLSAETELFIRRHLDQLIMCTIYGVCKVHQGIDMTFNNIINKYSDLVRNNKSISQIYFKILIDPKTGQEADIITFYNEVYIKTMKAYIISLKPGHMADASRNSILSPMPNNSIQGLMNINKPHVNALAPPSPLRESFPSYNFVFSTVYQTKPHMTPGAGARSMMRSPLIGSSIMTPVTRHLFAFNETPTGELDKANQLMQ